MTSELTGPIAGPQIGGMLPPVKRFTQLLRRKQGSFSKLDCAANEEEEKTASPLLQGRSLRAITAA